MNGKFRYAVWLAVCVCGITGCGGTAKQENIPKEEYTAESEDRLEDKAEAFEIDDTKKGSEDDTAEPEALHVEGTQLVDEAGAPVQLKGLSTHGLSWFPQYVNQELFTELSGSWNCNVVRLAMYSAGDGGYCTGGDQEKLKQLVRDGVQYAENAGMYVIVDWHVLGEGDPNAYKEEAKQFFEEMSKEFAGKQHVIYEICNEPNGGVSWEQVKAYALEVIPVIRANAPDAVIIVGTPTWSQDVDQAAGNPITEYDNVMYALHFYAADHKEELRNRMAAAIEGGLPVIVSEYGICGADGNGGIDEGQSLAWIELMNDMNVSYVAWNISNKAETSAIFVSGCNKTSGFSTEDLSENGRWLYRMLTGSDDMAASGSEATAEKKQEKTDVAKEDKAEQEKAGDGKDWKRSGDMEYRAVVCNSWESGGKTYEQYEVTLRNASSDHISEWAVELTFDKDFEVTDSWNGAYTAKKHKLQIKNVSYNGTAAPQEEIKDIGFIICYEDTAA